MIFNHPARIQLADTQMSGGPDCWLIYQAQTLKDYAAKLADFDKDYGGGNGMD